MWWTKIATYADNSVLYATVVGNSIVLRYDYASGRSLTTVPFPTEKDATDWIEANSERVS